MVLTKLSFPPTMNILNKRSLNAFRCLCVLTRVHVFLQTSLWKWCSRLLRIWILVYGMLKHIKIINMTNIDKIAYLMLSKIRLCIESFYKKKKLSPLLLQTTISLVLCSPLSVYCPWINQKGPWEEKVQLCYNE
jgi:hypothetical protein